MFTASGKKACWIFRSTLLRNMKDTARCLLHFRGHGINDMLADSETRDSQSWIQTPVRNSGSGLQENYC